MSEPSLLERLARHRALGAAPAHEHEWLLAHGTLRALPAGGVASLKGVPVTKLMILLSGHIVIRVDRGAGSHKIIEWRDGDVTGLLPYSRGAVAPSASIAEEPTELLEVQSEWFPEMIRECPTVTAKLVHAMLDRARQFTSSDLRDEKLVSLGKLAAGLAHELNNPASAAARNAKSLAESLAAAEEAARRLGAARLSDAQFTVIDGVREACLSTDATQRLSALDRSDREEAIAAWLAAHGGSESCAAPLAESGVTLDALESLAAVVTGDALDAALRWMAAGCSVRALTAAIETSASRIYELVAAVKGFTYMDHRPTVEPVDIRRGVADAVTMLGSKVREKSVVVSLQLADDLPPALAIGAELNQVWMNLVENALDAVGTGGRVTVIAGADLGRIKVEVIDDGPGIPPEIVGRIFDPFFTTKGVGKGTGLGLDIVRRLLQRQEAGIEVESRPGRTVFRVSLPIAVTRASGA